MRPAANRSRRVFDAPTLMMIVATAGLLVTLLATAGTSAQAQGSGTQDWLSRINGLRASKGLNALILDSNLSSLAQQRAEINARTGTLVHTPNLAAGVTSSWTKLAENIGAGQDHDGLWNAFVNSPAHYANLVDPAFTHVGIGEVVLGPGNVWVTHRFMKLAAATPAGNPATAAPAPAAAAPVYVVPVAPSTNRSTGNARTNGSGGATTNTGGSSATAPPAATTSSPPPDASATPADGGNSPSPEHVAAVVNVLSALEK